MRSRIKLAKLALTGVAALLIVSCGANTQSERRGESRDSDAQPIDSGRRLSGEFLLISIQDSYAAAKSHGAPETVLSFDESGAFKKQDKSRSEEGVYLITTRGELVTYIERVNGEMLPAARVDLYLILDQNGDSITLQSGRSRTLVLRKR